jgi:hypothetical protein
MTQDEFDSMRHRMNQAGGAANVTREELMKWRAIREEISWMCEYRGEPLVL